MGTKHTNSGIYAGDRVLVFMDSYCNGRRKVINLHYAEVERVTPTQAIIEGIRYHAGSYNDRRGEPVKSEDSEYIYDEKTGRGGRLRFAHPNIMGTEAWEHLVAQKERPESLARAQAISSAGYETFGYPFIMRLEQILELSKDPDLMLDLENKIQEVNRVRQEAIDDGRAFFAHALGIEVEL